MEAKPGALLLVDDDEVLRTPLARFLGDQGFTVTAVADGGEALAKIEKGGHDLVLLDVQMPRMDGLEACSPSAHPQHTSPGSNGLARSPWRGRTRTA